MRRERSIRTLLGGAAPTADLYVNTDTTDSCLLHKMRVSYSACADWPRTLQKHKQAQRRTTLALTSTQVTRGRDAERLLTRERLLHTHSACLSTAALACSSEKHAPLQSAKRKQLGGGRKTIDLVGKKRDDMNIKALCAGPPAQVSARQVRQRAEAVTAPHGQRQLTLHSTAVKGSISIFVKNHKQKKIGPRDQLFSLRALQGRVSL